MRYINTLVMVVIMGSLTGCVSIFGPTFSAPSDIKAECKRAQAEAKSAIESKGTKLGKEHSVLVKKHLGEKKFGQMWAWMDSYWKQYVGGLCYGPSGTPIEVGCNPQTLGEVWYEVEKHEFGHYWLLPIGSDGHDPLYQDCFFNWHDPKSKKILFVYSGEKEADVESKKIVDDELAGVKEGELVGFDFYNVMGDIIFHIDFVGTGK